VCTGQTVDGQPGLEGYYKEWDHALEPEERLQFSPGEECPPFDPERAPQLSNENWPEERLQKARRNYAMGYITTIIPETIAALGPSRGGHLAGLAARLTGMHFFDETARLLGAVAPEPAGFAQYLARLLRGQGEDAVVSGSGDVWTVRQTTWRLMRDQMNLSPAAFDVWNELWVGTALACDRWLQLDVVHRRDRGDDAWEWRISRRRYQPAAP
jgi:hypothetical protein